MGRSDWLVVAVSGATCSGKTTLAKRLQLAFPGAVLLHHDDYFLPVGHPNHSILPELNHINFEILSSLDNTRFLGEIRETLNGPGNLLILDGFLILNNPDIVELCGLKFYVTLDKETCWLRRSVRTYDPPDPAGYFESCVWPSYLEHFEQVQRNVRDVVYLSGSETVDSLFNCAFVAIHEKLKH